MEFWLILIFLILSAFFSGAETVFLSVNRVRLQGFLHKRRFGAKSAVWFMRDPARFILTTLVGTNLANIAYATVITAYMINQGIPSGWAMPLGAVILLIFGEFLPKALGRDMADAASLKIAPILRIYRILFYPIYWAGDIISTLTMNIFGIHRSDVREFFSRRDFEVLIRETAETGIISDQQRSQIARILNFRSLIAHEVMTPRTEIIALPVTSSVEELRQTARTSGLSKIPIYDKDIDHITGVAYALDLFNDPASIDEIIKPISYFPEQRKATVIFKDLRQNRQSIAVIVDEWGGTAGIITTEDLIEELTGEIEDEYDITRLQMKELGANRWLFSARMEIDEINLQYNLSLPEGEYETLGGYLTDATGKIPEKGEIITLDDYQYEIVKATRSRIRIVIVQRMVDED